MDKALDFLVKLGLDFNITSVLSILLFSMLFIGIFALLLRRKNLHRISYNAMIAGILFLGVRMLMPLEVLDVTYKLAVPYALQNITIFLHREAFMLKGEEVSRLQVLFGIWVIGAVGMFLWTGYKYIYLKRAVRSFGNIQDAKVQNILDNLLKERKKRNRFQLVSTNDVKMPMIVGVVKPYIILPAWEMTEEEIYYSLRHELAHYYNGDLVIKLGWELSRSILWWNPLMIVLQKQLYSLLELRADESAVRNLDEGKQLDYANCLIQAAKKQKCVEKKQQFILAYGGVGNVTVKQRVEVLLSRMKGKMIGKRICDVCIVLCLGLMLVVVNGIVLVPTHRPDYGKEQGYIMGDTFNSRDPGVFLVQNADGKYDFYCDYKYEFTAEEPFDRTMKVYTSLEEAMTNEK